jgi:hypothetical protein
LRKKGEGTVVILTDCRRGRRWGGNGQASVGKKWCWRRSVRVVLGCGEKRRGERRGDGPLYIRAEAEAAAGD